MFLDCSMKRLLLLLLLFTNEIAFSQTYVPINNAALAASEECWDQWTAAVSAKDYAAGDRLREQNCIIVYNRDKMNLKLVLVKSGSWGNPSKYYIKGNPNAYVWTYYDLVEEIDYD